MFMLTSNQVQYGGGMRAEKNTQGEIPCSRHPSNGNRLAKTISAA